MASIDSNDIVANIELVVRASRGQGAIDETARDALASVINWLAARVPYKETLPRGYSIHWTAQKDAGGVMRRYHQLLKEATARIGGEGVWIDTAALDQVQAGDIRVLANDLATGLLAELITFLQPAATH